MRPAFISLTLLALVPTAAMAGECVLNVTRTACPGQEATSYEKCGGEPSCEEVKKSATAEACAKEALKACENSPERQKTTKSKSITAKFDDAPVEGGKNFCDEGRPDYNKCG